MQPSMARLVVLAAGFMAICAVSASATTTAVVAVPSASPPTSDCSDVLTSMIDCFSYVTNGSDDTTAKPSDSCCAAVAGVLVKESAECICQTLQEAFHLGVAINLTRTLALPAACSVEAPNIHCDEPNPPDAPPSAPPLPPPVTPAPSPAAPPLMSSPGPSPSPLLPTTPSPTPVTPLPTSPPSPTMQVAPSPPLKAPAAAPGGGATPISSDAPSTLAAPLLVVLAAVVALPIFSDLSILI